jgi:hypothetical protein
MWLASGSYWLFLWRYPARVKDRKVLAREIAARTPFPGYLIKKYVLAYPKDLTVLLPTTELIGVRPMGRAFQILAAAILALVLPAHDVASAGSISTSCGKGLLGVGKCQVVQCVGSSCKSVALPRGTRQESSHLLEPMHRSL